MKKIATFLLLPLIIACSQKSHDIPNDILSIDKMTSIMVDIQLIEGSLSIMKYSKDKDQKEIINYYRLLYETHNINKPLFDKSLKYYCDRPELFVDIYEGVIIQLTELQAETETENKKE